jgi:hypothetical protein
MIQMRTITWAIFWSCAVPMIVLAFVARVIH